MWWRYLSMFLTVLALGAMAYLTSRFYRFSWTRTLSGGRKWRRLLLSAALAGLLLGLLWLCFGTFNAVMMALHLVVFWLVCDLGDLAMAKLRKAKPRRYYAGYLALGGTALYLAVGWFLAHNVWAETYTLTTAKDLGRLRVALVADAHVGTTFDGDGFGRWMEKLQSDAPDVVVIAGDFVDDDTSLADMEAACRALGRLDVPYGVYYVFGNHDKGYYGDAYRGYGGDDLAARLEANGVRVLADETVLLDDRFYLIGRKDRSEEQRGSGRLTMDQLTQGLDPAKYQIVLDHQPQDFAAQAASGVDLVLSGHTHGGWFFPMTILNRYTSADDLIYGHETRAETDFIVTSGISDWAMQFKTGCKSEYVIVDIATQAER